MYIYILYIPYTIYTIYILYIMYYIYNIRYTIPITYIESLETPTISMCEYTVFQLKWHMSGGHTHLWDQHLKGWLWEAYPDRETTSPPPPPNPAHWEKLVALAQNMWEHSIIPTEMRWTILILLPKVNTDTQGV